MRVKELVLPFAYDDLVAEAEEQGDWVIPDESMIEDILRELPSAKFWLRSGDGQYADYFDGTGIRKANKLFKKPTVVVVDRVCSCPNCGYMFKDE